MTRRLVLRSLVALLIAALALPGPATAQELPLVLLHGLQSSGAQWNDTAARLRAELQVQTAAPELVWKQPYAQQAAALQQSRPDLAALPASTAFLGHSNGGVVAREWSRLRPAGGIVTIGTPHGGAPLMPQTYNWQIFQNAGGLLLNRVGAAFSRNTPWTWILPEITWVLGWVGDFNWWSVVYLAAALGLERTLPVANDMRPGSPALTSLNSSSNLLREQAAVPVRVGIVSAAHNFYWAGPARAIAPDQADAIAATLYGTAGFLAGWSAFIFLRADASDLNAIEQASSLADVAGYLWSIDPFYCSIVTSLSANDCVYNDGVVPYTSQIYPGAVNVYIGFDYNDGPAHTQEMQQHDVMKDVLIRYLRVPPRAVPPPAPPTPVPPVPPAPPPPGEPEEPEITGTWQMAPGAVLWPGDLIRSADGRYELDYQGDGNLVLYDQSGTPLWASHTAGTTPGVVAMQGDGNFVIYDGSNVPVWNSGTHGHPGAFLEVQNDGNVVIYAPHLTPLWATGTAR